MLNTDALERAKASVLIPDLGNRLGIPTAHTWKVGAVGQCAFGAMHKNGDRNHSFSINDAGTLFHCFGCGASGDAVTLVKSWRGCTDREAIETVERMAGVFCDRPPPKAEPVGKPDLSKALALLRPTTCTDVRAIAKMRKLPPEFGPSGVDLARQFGILKKGNVCRFDSWVLVDPTRYAAEGRRMDGELYPEFITGDGKKIQSRKAHTLGGSRKDWPMGLGVLSGVPPAKRGCWPSIVLVEGGPDYLACLGLLYHAGIFDAFPISMLASKADFGPEALRVLSGMRILILPHDDANGAGMEACRRWAGQLKGASCQVSARNVSALAPEAHDLNDFAALNPPVDQLSNLFAQ